MISIGIFPYNQKNFTFIYMYIGEKSEKRIVFQTGSFVTFVSRSRICFANRTKLLGTKERQGHTYENLRCCL